jgi:SAM-dependent methyltransferase
MCALDINENYRVYYEGNYWNNLECTARMINRRISGDEDVVWWRHFAECSERVFERALILNCGNGWVEREMVESGFVKQAVGIDYSAELLKEARSAAASLPIRYEQANINTDALPNDDFDLVVNHAAGHHITMLNRVFREISVLLPVDGWFISFDYVGPHRNQWSIDAWDAAWKINKRLPENVRQSLVYPNIPLMLATDPTEAVHSELILHMTDRYFRIEELVPLGGAIAYPLLTHNSQIFGLHDLNERERWGQYLLDRDEEYLSEHPESSLFAYFTAQPDKHVLSDQMRLDEWQSEEDVREARAAENGGEYFEHSALQDVYEELACLELTNSQLSSQLEAIRNSYLYSRVTRLLDMKVINRALQSGWGRRLMHALKKGDSPPE